MEINNDVAHNRVWAERDGNISEVEYIVSDGMLNIIHTFVPQALEGQGIASQLVKYAYDYALEQGLRPIATCSYARAWLKRHPEYVK